MDIVYFPLYIICCEVFDKTDHIGVRGAHCLLVINSTGFLVTSLLCCVENLSCLVNFWCIIGGSVEVLNEVQSILIH